MAKDDQRSTGRAGGAGRVGRALAGLGVTFGLMGGAAAAPASASPIRTPTHVPVVISTGGGAAPSVRLSLPVTTQTAAGQAATARRAGSSAAWVTVSRHWASPIMPPGFIGLSL